MYSAINYETDNEVDLAYSVALYIGYQNEYSSQAIINDGLIPPILIPRLQWFRDNACFTKQIVARFVTIDLSSGTTLKIAYPFRPGTANWFTFWQQLQSPEIVSVKGFGEKGSSKFLKNSLGITT